MKPQSIVGLKIKGIPSSYENLREREGGREGDAHFSLILCSFRILQNTSLLRQTLKIATIDTLPSSSIHFFLFKEKYSL